ncbi:MAG: Tim44/TimA family putative adaptor protein [Alphaproteobacteria bacterium]|nr:Tim44/TimA family putative adaptor protein [Alphaproteobacteria bacterium]
MGGSFEFFDIILFAMFAAFLVYRLRSVLGKRTGNEPSDRQQERRGADAFLGPDERNEADDGADSDRNDGENIISLLDRSDDDDGVVPEPKSQLHASFLKIRALDQSFDPDTFLEGALGAFEMILQAYTEGDGKTLNTLLSPEVYENFAGAIRVRELANNTQENTLAGIKSAEIIDAELEEQVARVTVKIVSEQINSTRDENGDVIDGDPSAVVQVTDIWVFVRDTKSSNPNWTLLATGRSN